MFSKWRRKRGVKKLVQSLPSDLTKRYGFSDFYTEEQIQTTLKDLDYPDKFHGYAFVLCMELKDAANVIGSSAVAEQIATELAEWFFHGRRDFKPIMFSRTGSTDWGSGTDGD